MEKSLLLFRHVKRSGAALATLQQLPDSLLRLEGFVLLSYCSIDECELEGMASLGVLSVYHGASSAICYREQKVGSNVPSPG